MNKDLEFIYINLDDNNNTDSNNDNADASDTVSDTEPVYDEHSENTVTVSPEDIKQTAEDTPKEKKPRLRGRIIREIISYVFIIAAAFVLAVLTNRFLIVNAKIPSGSMIPTIKEGNRIIGNRLAYINSDPKRGDVVVFYYPDDESQKFIKRIIGLPGETIYISDGIVYIDGQPLDESDYLTVETYGVSGPFTIPDNCYFMMGDNRNSSNDSRFWVNHFVSKDKIIAKALFCYFPTIHLID